MKKFLPTLAILFVGATVAGAQPVLTMADMTPEFGTEATIHSTSYVDNNGEGANMNWDFSGLTSESSDFMVVTDPQGQPGTGFFPDATHAWFVNENEYFTVGYYQYVNNKSNFLGTYDILQVSHVFSDPLTNLVFPLSFGDVFFDTYYVELGGSEDPTVVLHGQTTSTVTGYGTATSPIGVFQDVLQVHVMDFSTTTFIYNDTVTSGDSSIVESYNYYKAGLPYPLVSMSAEILSEDLSPIGSYSDIVSGLDPKAANRVDFRVFPNPTSYDVNLDFRLDRSGEVEINLLSVDGRSVAQLMDRRTLPSGRISIRKNLPDLAAGTYLIRIQTPDGIATRKLVKTAR